MKEKEKTFGEMVKRRRETLALSQRDLARSVGVKASYIAYIESGRRRPSLSLLRRLADTLGLNGEQVLMLAYPEAKALVSPHKEPEPFLPHDHAWRQFIKNKALLKRSQVTRSELAVLKQVSLHWRVTSPLHFLLILNSVRQAVQGIGVKASPRARL